MPSVWVPRENAKNARDYGARCDGATDDCAALSTLANTRMQPAGGDLHLEGVSAISSPLDLPENVAPKFGPGAALRPGNGVSVTIRGLLDAHPNQRVFQNVGPGAGSVQILKPQSISPYWFGAKADGRKLTDVSVTAGSTTIDSASYTFTSADVGKPISVIYGTGLAASGISATAGQRTFTLPHAGSPIPTSVLGQLPDEPVMDPRAAINGTSTGHKVVINGAGAGGAALTTLITDTDASATNDTFHIQDLIGTTVSGATGVYFTNTLTTIQSVSGGNAVLALAPNQTISNATVYFGTDDTAAVTQALLAGSASGSPVRFPAGVYCVNNVQVPSGAHLYFDPGARVQSTPAPDITPLFYAQGTAGARLSDVSFHGHRTILDGAGSAAGCIKFDYVDFCEAEGFVLSGSNRAATLNAYYCTRYRFKDCDMAGGAYGFVSENSVDGNISGCHSTDGGYGGFLIYHLSERVTCEKCTSKNGAAWYQTGSGAGFEGYTSLDLQFLGCKSTGTTNNASSGIRFRDVFGGVASGCTIADTADAGIRVANKARGASGNNYFTDFYTGGRITITNNVIHDTAGVGIDVATTEVQDAGVIQNNTLYNIGYVGGVATNQSSGIRVEHPGWVIGNNDLANIGGPGIQTLDAGFPADRMSPDRLVIGSNHINGASRASANTQGGILLASTSRNVVIAGNVVEDDLAYVGTPTTGYGIKVVASGNTTATVMLGTNQILYPPGGNAIQMSGAKAVPQVKLGAAAQGAGAAVTVVAPSCDQWGQITFASGTGTMAAGVVASIYPRLEMTHTPRVVLTPVLANTPPLQAYATAGNPGLALSGGSTFATVGTTMTATGSLFTIELNVGDLVTISSQTRMVTAIASDTSLTLASALTADVSGQSCTAPRKSKWDLSIVTAPTASVSYIWYYRMD